jgi:hypothetical protein
VLCLALKDQCYQHRVVENIAKGSEMKISEISGKNWKISKNVDKTNILKISKNI